MTDNPHEVGSPFRQTAIEIFRAAGVARERNPERFIECVEILFEKMKILDSAVKRELCDMKERNELWEKQVIDLTLHLRHLLLQGEVLP